MGSGLPQEWFHNISHLKDEPKDTCYRQKSCLVHLHSQVGAGHFYKNTPLLVFDFMPLILRNALVVVTMAIIAMLITPDIKVCENDR